LMLAHPDAPGGLFLGPLPGPNAPPLPSITGAWASRNISSNCSGLSRVSITFIRACSVGMGRLLNKPVCLSVAIRINLYNTDVTQQ